MKLFEFIKSKSFLKHLAISLLSLLVIFWFVFKYLDHYTLHGDTITVPDFNGIKVNKLDSFIADKNLYYMVIDSIFDARKARGIVVKQDPLQGIQVKKDRTIYLYVTAALPPKIRMPKLQDKSLRQAIATLESYGLKTGQATYVPDECTNCVLQQTIKGKKIEPGTMVEKGSVVNLVVGQGLSNKEIASPDLTGLTRSEANETLAELSLNEGSVHFEQPVDSLKARIYKQIPARSTMIKLGSSIDLFFSNKAERFPLMNDSLIQE